MWKNRILAYDVIISTLLIWIICGNFSLVVTRYSVVSDKLPKAFDHYKIVVLSDLHDTEIGNDNSLLTSLIKKEKPNMIAITGDLIDSTESDVTVDERFMQKLIKICPCYYVSGNHEATLGKFYLEFEQQILAMGVTVLRDRATNIKKDNQTIQIAGLFDPNFTRTYSSKHKSDMLQTKLKQMKLSDDYCILLSHRPEVFKIYVAEKIDLVLCGHAHGGGIRLPFIGGLIAPNQGLFPKYDAGAFSRNNTTMILSRGVGNGTFRFRINNRPEIVVVELLRKTDSITPTK